MNEENYLPPGSFPVHFGARAYDPAAGADDGEGGKHSNLFEHSLGGDWSWKPARDKALGYDSVTGPPSRFKTFRGVPPSAAELYRNRMHQPG